MSVYRNRPKETSQRGRWFLAACVLILVVSFLTSGCQSAPIKAVSSAELAGLCHAADGLTTALAISKGAVEANPLMAPIVSAVGPWGFLALKLALGYWVYTKFKEMDEPVAIGLHNLVICGAAVHNVGVIRSLP